MSGRSEGRARGRAKAKTAPPSSAATAQSSAAAAAAAQMAQQSRPQGETIKAAPQALERPPAASMHGRVQIRAPGPTRPAHGGGAGDAPPVSQMRGLDIRDEPAQMGRGGVRGRREIAPSLRTKPPSIEAKTGSFGDSIMLQANYVKLLTQTDWCLYQYRVDFEPDEERTGIRKKLLRIHKDKFSGFIFDGSTMWTTTLVRPDPLEVWSERESDQAKIRITVRKVADLSIGDPAYLQLFNVITRKCLEFLGLQLVGRDYFDPGKKVSIRQHQMELWPGYSTSIRQHEDAILLNVEVTHKVMRLQTVLDILRECYNRSHNWKEVFLNSVVGSTVMTEFNKRTYRIDDVNFDGTPNDTFDLKGGTKTSYVDYYKNKYDIRIQDLNQPLLISRASARERRSGMSETITLIPELCRATGLTDEMRANVMLMRALADQTRIPPSGRIEKIKSFLSHMHQTRQIVEQLTMWNLTLAKDLVEFRGRKLPFENIVHGNDTRSQQDRADWTHNLRNHALLLDVKFTNWAIITPGKLRRDATNFASTLAKAASSFKFMIPPQPRVEEIPDDKSGTYVEALDRMMNQMNPQLIMCIVPNNRADRYSAIKKKACVDRCVPTQVVLAKNISAQSKGIMSIATKIAIQLNCKLGGAPWSVEIPINGLMVVGYDATHDTMSKSKSFGAVVCSLNKYLTQYYSAVAAHSSGEELSNMISVQIINGCLKYKQKNNELPSRIIIYRDAVGEGQLGYVYQHEIAEIRNKLKTLYCDQEPKLAVVVVSKRINTRIFYRGENPPPGTIADDVITSPDRYDFFLVSQSVKQGSVSPTSYNVIYDTTGLPPDRMQRFTYKLTHLYFNWSGTVRVPAPCQYAHKLAMLVGQAIHRSPHDQLSDRLYFL